ncbi:vam6/vps39 related [Schistosoma mansoni]|uniref:vam6/vps39 related n=1 Tax=Schistosoma mansoni TaxID=6183 RepID=UPI00022DC335|nr:vam6/vps39 related [Schistosoma mansoni]|eukprot:XP_018649796.1 vam6/vps39 related [Schistosoma mansoni]
MTIPEVVRSISFCGLSKLAVGHRGEYLLINIISGEMQLISAVGKNQLPIITSLSHCFNSSNLNEFDSSSCIFDKFSFFKNSTMNSENLSNQSILDHNNNDENNNNNNKSSLNQYYHPMLPGSCTFLGIERDDVLSVISPFHEYKSIFQIKWSNIPYQVHIFPPYIIGTMDNTLEIRTLNPNKLIQQLAITRVTAMCYSKCGWFYASTAPASTTNTLFSTDSFSNQQKVNVTESINNASSIVRGKSNNGNEIWVILSASRLKFIQNLVEKKEFELAICLAKTSLYSGQNPVETLQITILYAIHLYHEKHYSKALNLFTEQLINPIHVLDLFPGMLSDQEQHQIEHPCDINIISSSEMINAFEPLITYLLTWRRLLNKTTIEQCQIIDKTIKNIKFHNDRRISKISIIKELIMLYQSRGLHQEALSILQQFNSIRMKQTGYVSTMTESNPNAKLPLNVTLDNNYNPGLIEQIGHPKRIIHYFIHYLDASHLNLLLDYSKNYILRYHPISWLRILYYWEQKLTMKYRSEILVSTALNDKDKKGVSKLPSLVLCKSIDR